jgi:hypothetical protein
MISSSGGIFVRNENQRRRNLYKRRYIVFSASYSYSSNLLEKVPRDLEASPPVGSQNSENTYPILCHPAGTGIQPKEQHFRVLTQIHGKVQRVEVLGVVQRVQHYADLTAIIEIDKISG